MLRGVAALMVVLFHASQQWSAATRGSVDGAWFRGEAGVDIFFVISGFVMAVSSLGRGEGPRAAWDFLKRRFVRVLPLYWLITTLLVIKIQLGWVLSTTGLRHFPWSFAACSYLLIPCQSPQGMIVPLLAPGWTLTFEMFFYLCFAAALWTRKSVPGCLTVVLGAMAVAGLFRTAQWPVLTVLCNPQLLEFLGGLWLGRMVQAKRVWNWRWAAPLSALGFLVLWLLPASARLERLEWGLGGMLAIQAAVAFEGMIGPLVPRWCLLIGDASYSLYLTHAPFLGLCTFALKKTKLLVPAQGSLKEEAIVLFAFVLLSILLGVFVFQTIESPMNRWFRERLRLRQPVQTEASAEPS